MPNMPTGTFDADRIASELYDNDEVRGHYFAAAYERFPGYNDRQSFDAADYIMDRFATDFADKYTDDEWDKISEILYENVLAGLT